MSLLKYDDAEQGVKVNPSPGYPVVCITVSFVYVLWKLNKLYLSELCLLHVVTALGNSFLPIRVLY